LHFPWPPSPKIKSHPLKIAKLTIKGFSWKKVLLMKDGKSKVSQIDIDESRIDVNEHYQSPRLETRRWKKWDFF